LRARAAGPQAHFCSYPADGARLFAYCHDAKPCRTELETFGFRQRNWQPEGESDKTMPGLGTIIVEALAKQLDARVETLTTKHSRTVSIHLRAILVEAARRSPRCLEGGSWVLWSLGSRPFASDIRQA
jgi:hypothetical protein